MGVSLGLALTVYPAIVYVVLLCCSLSLSPAPPLTLKNVLKVVEGVKNWKELAAVLNGYISSNVTDIVKQFLSRRGHYKQPSWRAVIFSLDGAGETHFADRIRHYAEPVRGRTATCYVKMLKLMF